MEPLKGAGRLILFGVLGSLVAAVGVLLLMLGLLRWLQTYSAFSGNFSWVPYLLVAAVASISLVLTTWRVLRGASSKRRAGSKS